MPPTRVDAADAGSGGAAPTRGALAQTALLIGRASHPRRALLTASALAAGALLSGRGPREVGLVAGTVLVGQALLGWHNDLVDRERDRAWLDAAEVDRKPLAAGTVRGANAWFAIACALLVVVPLALTNGVVSGACYLGSLAAGLVGNVVLRRSWLSFVPWAAAFAAYPAFLSYGGWAGAAPSGAAGPPHLTIVALAALLGVGVHVLGALPDLVEDNRAGYRHLPLRIAMRTGATRLLVLATLWTLAVAGAIVASALASGLRA